MPKLIDYPRTTYAGAWELAEIVDDTGGKCAIDTAARKLNRKVSGSFKAIIGSSVKFGLITSKRDLLTTTTLFKRIKHAYDKQEELLFHREAFLTPPLFTQLCRKFRSRELPVQMLDVMLIREFGVEEINAQGVAKAFVEGCRMVGLLDERNIVADIDALAAKQGPRRELASPQPTPLTFRPETNAPAFDIERTNQLSEEPTVSPEVVTQENFALEAPTRRPAAMPTQRQDSPDAIASLFGLPGTSSARTTMAEESNVAATKAEREPYIFPTPQSSYSTEEPSQMAQAVMPVPFSQSSPGNTYQIQVSGPGINTTLSITEEEDIAIAQALLDKIRRQLKG